MTNSYDGIGNPIERELAYYRREYNDLGARLLRLQEEQSQAALEARRSRTVVRLVREAYRLAEPTQTTGDVGGPLLQVIVENALCDRAALLREEPVGSGNFLVAHAIGSNAVAADNVLTIPDPPGFFFTNFLVLGNSRSELLGVLGLPFVLWAYDRSSGYALAIGNRSESNVSRPFEAGDQELIEAALFVYLDVLYRKHAEAKLRQTKQAAEEASQVQARFLEALSKQLQLPVGRIIALLPELSCFAAVQAGPTLLQNIVRTLDESSREIVSIAGDAALFTAPKAVTSFLDVQWIDTGEMLHRVFRSSQAVDAHSGISLIITVPQRRISVCVDRESMDRAIRIIIHTMMACMLQGSTMRLSAERRSDGSLEVLVSTLSILNGIEKCDTTGLGRVWEPFYEFGADILLTARRIVEAHEAILVTEPRLNGGSDARIIFPSHIIRTDNATS